MHNINDAATGKQVENVDFRTAQSFPLLCTPYEVLTLDLNSQSVDRVEEIPPFPALEQLRSSAMF